jgi:hypothetical protein
VLCFGGLPIRSFLKFRFSQIMFVERFRGMIFARRNFRRRCRGPLQKRPGRRPAVDPVALREQVAFKLLTLHRGVDGRLPSVPQRSLLAVVLV